MTNLNEISMIGQPVYWQSGAGWIAGDGESTGNVYTIGAGGLQANRKSFVIVWDAGSYSQDVSEHIAAPWLARAAEYKIEAKSPAEVAAMLEAAKEKHARDMAEREAEREAHAQKVLEYRDQIRDKVPSWATSVIVGEYVEDESDSQTDYFNSTTSRTIILAFSKHNRDLFPEMRKAARNHEATAHLADAPASAEHREKYSMGGGYFLKDGYRHNTGWKVRKQVFYGSDNDPAAAVPFGEWAVPVAAPRAKPEAATPEAATVDGATISEHVHTKRGFQMWIVAPSNRVEREEFMRLLGEAKKAGGWYSRKWGSTPAGFAFKDYDAAKAFSEGLGA